MVVVESVHRISLPYIEVVMLVVVVEVVMVVVVHMVMGSTEG